MVHKLLALVLVLVNASVANGCSDMWNRQEYPCNQYFHICNDHIEGFEGYLRLPVLQEMNPQKMSSDDRKLFENGDIKITFSHELDVLHPWEEDHGLRQATDKGNKQNFTIFVKDVYRDRMERLSTGDHYKIDLTWRSHLLHPDRRLETNKQNVIGIQSIQFGNFICPEPPIQEEILPACRIFMIDSTMTDGYRAAAVFNVPSKKDHWVARMKFSVPIRNFDTPTGDRKREEGVEDEFKITSLRHNGKVHGGQEFHLEFTVHVYGNNDAERSTNKRGAKKILAMSFNEFSCAGSVIVNRWR